MINLPKKAFERPSPNKFRGQLENPAEVNQKVYVDDTGEFENESDFHMKHMCEYLTLKCNFECTGLCFGSHSEEPLRRMPFRLMNGSWNYYPDQCLSKNCEFGAQCLFAHNTAEALFHPLLYKISDCGYPLINEECSENGIHCPYAHGDKRTPSLFHLDPEFKKNKISSVEEQINANKNNLQNYSTYKTIGREHVKLYNRTAKTEVFDIETFKTRSCDKPFVHEHKVCVFYHGITDKRRKTNFKPFPCKNLYNSESKTFISGICSEGDRCKFAHSDTEILYHEENYKKEACPNVRCELQDFCPYIHKEINQNKTDLKRELNDLINKHSMLTNLVNQEKSRIEKLKKFLCVYCKKFGYCLMLCGHILCKECSTKQKCVVCGTNQKKIAIALNKE